MFVFKNMKQIPVISEKALSAHNIYLVIDPSKLLIYGSDATNRRFKLIIKKNSDHIL